jgi:TusE/DsrC/DsvC family sulfur relay protein
MTLLGSGSKKILVDEEGFLDGTQRWDEDVAHLLAKHEGIEELDKEKMEIVKYLRFYYSKYHTFPILGNICKKAGNKSKDCVTREFIDPMKAWKIAGLPKPSNIFFTSFDGKKYTPNPFY